MPGLPLKNWHGTTCFVNAVVQVFVHNPYIREEAKGHLGQLCQCRSCLTCYLAYCVHSAYGKTAQTELALPAWMLQHGFPKLAAGKGHQQALSPELQVMILFVCQICVKSQALDKLKRFKHSSTMCCTHSFVSLLTQEDAHDFIRQWLDGAQQHLKGCIKQV